MHDPEPCILVLNGGSSSIKFALYAAHRPTTPLLRGEIQRIGEEDPILTVRDRENPPERLSLARGDVANAASELVARLHDRLQGRSVVGAGHRVVHGGARLLEHQRITPQLVEELQRIIDLDPPHLPVEIALMRAMDEQFPGVPQVACFDTAFHRELPRVATLFPIPRRFLEAGVRRFGFHGLSYTYLMQALRGAAGDDAADGRVILAHLGSGASMAAVHHARPVDTTMAFTPTAGLMMGTRPGDLDPGLLLYLMRQEKLSPEATDEFINKRCGLIGLSETSSDMRDLLVRRSGDPRAAEAVALFCHQARKWIGALAAALGGLDQLVFSGGIGEHAAPVRAEICAGLEFLGIRIDQERNTIHAPVISQMGSGVTVRVIPTDEEIVMAQTVRSILGVT
jgi:acetate kinase